MQHKTEISAQIIDIAAQIVDLSYEREWLDWWLRFPEVEGLLIIWGGQPRYEDEKYQLEGVHVTEEEIPNMLYRTMSKRYRERLFGKTREHVKSAAPAASSLNIPLLRLDELSPECLEWAAREPGWWRRPEHPEKEIIEQRVRLLELARALNELLECAEAK